MHVPSISTTKSYSRKLRLSYGPCHCWMIEVRDNSVALPRTKIRQPLVLLSTRLNINVVVTTLMHVCGKTRHYLQIVGVSGIID